MGPQGLADLAYTIEEIRKNVNADLRMLGAVINLYKPRRNLSAESHAEVEAGIALVHHVFDTKLHDYSKKSLKRPHKSCRQSCMPRSTGRQISSGV
jgi:cellulose biosynthesis protein BcsQ